MPNDVSIKVPRRLPVAFEKERKTSVKEQKWVFTRSKILDLKLANGNMEWQGHNACSN